MVFDRWEITGNTELTGGFDASAEKTQFTMPNTSVTIRAMYRMADVEEPNVLGTVAVVATAGVGAAILGWMATTSPLTCTHSPSCPKVRQFPRPRKLLL